MSGLFSSPSKQANAAASAQQGLTDHSIQQLEDYVTKQQGELRGAISGLPANPYLGAAEGMSPESYRVDPSDTVNYGQSNLPPGLSQGQSTAVAHGMPMPSQNPFTPPYTPPTVTPPTKPPIGVGPGRPEPGGGITAPLVPRHPHLPNIPTRAEK